MRRAELLAVFALLAAPIARAQDTMSHAPHMEWGRTSFLLTEVLERRTSGDAVRFDLVGWVGGSSRRFWFKADGALLEGDKELQALYGRMIAPYWDLQLGAWADIDSGDPVDAPIRGGAAIGVQGIAPGWFDVDAALLIGTDARLSSRLTASHDLYVTQRLILQPRLEASWAARPDRQRRMGAGLGETELALRLRYEIRREFAPYLGVAWDRAFGETGTLDPTSGRRQFALGLRLWF